MANAAFQVSSKMNDGRIFVVAGETYTEFSSNLASVLGSEGAETLLSTMAGSLEGAAQSVPQAVGMLAQGLGATPVGGPTQTGNITFGYSSVNQTANIANGNTAAGSTKTVNLGVSAGPGSNTRINIGPRSEEHTSELQSH